MISFRMIFSQLLQYGPSFEWNYVVWILYYSLQYLIHHIWSIHFSIESHMLYKYVSWWLFISKIFSHNFHNMVLQLNVMMPSYRRLPLTSSFDEYLTIRSSCWILEERDGDYFCDCPVGMKVSCIIYYSIQIKVLFLG